MKLNRRDFIKRFGAFVAGLGLGATKAEAKEVAPESEPTPDPWAWKWVEDDGKEESRPAPSDWRIAAAKFTHSRTKYAKAMIDHAAQDLKAKGECFQIPNDWPISVIQDGELIPVDSMGEAFDLCRGQEETVAVELGGRDGCLGVIRGAPTFEPLEGEVTLEIERTSACDDCPYEHICGYLDDVMPRAEAAMIYGCVNDDGAFGPEHELPDVNCEQPTSTGAWFSGVWYADET